MLAPAPSSQRIAIAAFRDGLKALGFEVPVSVQRDTTDKFVVVSRAGGGSGFALSRPRLLVECYATDEIAAEQLAEAAYVAPWRVVGRRWHGGTVTGWSGDNNLVRFDDPDTNHFRFQFTGVLGIGITPAPTT